MPSQLAVLIAVPGCIWSIISIVRWMRHRK